MACLGSTDGRGFWNVAAWTMAWGALVCVAACDDEVGDGHGAGGLNGSFATSGAAGAPGTTAGAGGTTQESPSANGSSVAGGDASWCAAQKVFEARCQLCHDAEPAYGAPMSLVSHADTQKAGRDGRPVHQLVSERIHSPDEPMPPIAQGELAAEEMAALDAWIAAGAPAGPAAGCDAEPAPGGDGGVAMGEGGVGDAGVGAQDDGEPVWPEECEEYYEIRAGVNGQPYEVAANAEERRSFEIPVPWDGQVYALAIKPLTNNKRVVHHWILYEGTFSMVTSWSPGKEFETFKDGVGVYMPASGNLRLEMHYYNVGNDQAELDDSGLEVCVTRKQVQHVATTHMFSGPATVPPQQRVTNVGECTVSVDEPVHLITSSPHMHSYGVHAKFEVLRGDGSVETVHDTPFDWEDQTIKPVDVELFDGDVVRTTCVYENDTNQTIRFGEDSADEMCFNFARYYPRGALSCSGGGLFGGFF